MAKLLLSLLLMLCLQQMHAQNKEIETLTKLNQSWIASYPNKDAATLKNILADDFVLINGKGAKMTKADIIGNLSKMQIISAHVDSASVRLLNAETGIVTGYASFVLKDAGKETTGRTCYQDVYVKRNEKWQAVSAHVTNL
jgi:ketosteroid isomerase-like protein